MIIKKNKSQKINEPAKSSEGQPSEVTGVTPYQPQDISRDIIKEREERRRGDRRRGYRRIDDRSLVSRAQEEANAIKESASKEGFEYGVDISREEVKKLNFAISELFTAKEKVMQNSIPDIAVLAVKAAEKIIKKELKINEKLILSVVSEVIQSMSKNETEIIIKTNPNDVEIVKENLPEIYPYNETTKIKVMPDEEVDWGSCIVETKNGIIDARFSTQLQILQKALEEGL